MIHLIFNLLVRLLSGWKNGAYYGKERTHLSVVSVLLLTTFVLYPMIVTQEPILAKHYFMFIPIGITVWMVTVTFEKHKGEQIHLLEYILTGSFSWIQFFFFEADLMMLLMSALIGDTLFKMPINYYIGRRLIERVDGTDDPTGKTLGVYIGKHHFHVPRLFSNGWTKLAVGTVLLALWFVWHYGGGSVTIDWK